MTTACGAISAFLPSSGQHVARPSANAATNDLRCESLARRGLSPCPPGSLELEPIAIKNGTRGTVDDEIVRMDGQAYLRAHALYMWAVGRAEASAILTSGVLAPPDIAQTNAFRGEVEAFTRARASGSGVSFQALKTTAIRLVPVPPNLQEAARRQGLEPSPYAWVDNQAGPAKVVVQGKDGSRRTTLSIPPGEPHPVLVFGELKDDPDLGFIWFQGGIYGCLTTPELRATCQL
jgi:hypothetical protein